MSKTLVICSSANFYEHVTRLADELERHGCAVVIPKSAQQMRQRGDYRVKKTWYDDPSAYDQKADLMRSHFNQITSGDAILVVNDEKHGTPGYIGPNVLMEMSLAWYQQKPIFMLHPFAEDTPFEEEIKGMRPTILNGSLTTLIQELHHG